MYLDCGSTKPDNNEGDLRQITGRRPQCAAQAWKIDPEEAVGCIDVKADRLRDEMTGTDMAH